jgi:hypothetical protein
VTDDRRVADEAFRRELAERMRAVEIGLTESRSQFKEILSAILDMKMSQMELRYTLFGGPKQDDVGLLEKFRKMLWKAGIAMAVVVGVIAFLGKLIAPLYDKAVTDYVFNSPSEKWKVEHSKPKITHKTYIIQHPSADPGD